MELIIAEDFDAEQAIIEALKEIEARSNQ